MSKEKIKEVMSDKAFVEGLLKLETPEEVQKAFAKKGVTVSVEEIMQLKAALVKVAEKGGDLSMAEMDEVAGGSPILWDERAKAAFESISTFLNITISTSPPQALSTFPGRSW